MDYETNLISKACFYQELQKKTCDQDGEFAQGIKEDDNMNSRMQKARRQNLVGRERNNMHFTWHNFSLCLNN